MNWCSSFAEPTQLDGDWTDRRAAFFWHDDDPLAVKFAIERMTCTVLRRELGNERALVFAGASPAGPDPRSVRMTVEAVIDGRSLHSFTIDRSAPRRWTTGKAFTAECARVFAYWCSKLEVVAASGVPWERRSAAAHDALVKSTTAAALAAASVVEDPAPAAAMQRAIVAALRTGRKGFFDAHKEGGMHVYFRDPVFVRADFGEEPDRCETYDDDVAILDALRRYFEWDTRRDHYPHMPPALEVWTYIHGRLVDRDA